MVGKPLPWIAWLLAIGGLGTYFLWPEHLTVNTPLPKVFSTGTLPDSVLHERLRLPPGFAISSYATGLGHARVLIFADQGELLYSTPRSGEVWLLEQDRDGDPHQRPQDHDRRLDEIVLDPERRDQTDGVRGVLVAVEA